MEDSLAAIWHDFLAQSTVAPTLLEAMRYSLDAGGKRLRPKLMLATVAGFGATVSKGCYQVAAALEMVHTYSLIHDDLPAMDNDDLRRGKPTSHVVFGEAQAILAGDGLLTGAFELLAGSEIALPARAELLLLLAQKAGNRGMIAGQVFDIAAEKTAINLADLKHLHRLKTGALIEFSFLAGGILAGQPKNVGELLEKVGTHFGLAFQIRDDILDVEGTAAELGKNPHRDQALTKSTYPSLLGLAGAKKALAAEIATTAALISELAEVHHFEGDVILSLLNQLKGSL